jgi:cell surface protein SprA
VVNTNAKPQVQNNEFIDGLMGVLTSVKNIQVNYTDSGTVLPGYTPSVGFLGSSRPSLGFTLGAKMMFDMKLQKMVGLLLSRVQSKFYSGYQ